MAACRCSNWLFCYLTKTTEEKCDIHKALQSGINVQNPAYDQIMVSALNHYSSQNILPVLSTHPLV